MRLRRSPSSIVALIAGAIALLFVVDFTASVGRAVPPPTRLLWPSGWTADVILVPSGDHRAERTLRAAELMKSGHGSRLLISGAGAGGDSASFLADFAHKAGVPKDAIMLEEEATDTFENMTYSQPILEKVEARRVLVVTSNFHARRAALVAESVFRGLEVKVEPVPASQDRLTSRLREYLKTWRYILMGRLPITAAWIFDW